ncbi:hypothetical protein ACHQM5_014976 [Ranunculus cassubicifolius]
MEKSAAEAQMRKTKSRSGIEKLAAGLGKPAAEVEVLVREYRKRTSDERNKLPTCCSFHVPNFNFEGAGSQKKMSVDQLIQSHIQSHIEAHNKSTANKPIDDASKLNKLCSLLISEDTEDPYEEIQRSSPSLGSVC